MKTGKAFTSGSVLKGAHVAVAVAETTIKKETHIFSNVIFAPPLPLVGVGGREPADLPRGSKSENLESRAAPILRNYGVFFHWNCDCIKDWAGNWIEN